MFGGFFNNNQSNQNNNNSLFGSNNNNANNNNNSSSLFGNANNNNNPFANNLNQGLFFGQQQTVPEHNSNTFQSNPFENNAQNVVVQGTSLFNNANQNANPFAQSQNNASTVSNSQASYWKDSQRAMFANKNSINQQEQNVSSLFSQKNPFNNQNDLFKSNNNNSNSLFNNNANKAINNNNNAFNAQRQDEQRLFGNSNNQGSLFGNWGSYKDNLNNQNNSIFKPIQRNPLENYSQCGLLPNGAGCVRTFSHDCKYKNQNIPLVYYNKINLAQNNLPQQNNDREYNPNLNCICGVFHPKPPKDQQLTFNFQFTLPQNFNPNASIFDINNNIYKFSQAQNFYNIGCKIFNDNQPNSNQGGLFSNSSSKYKYKIDFNHNFTQDSEGQRKKIKETVIMKKIYKDQCFTRNGRHLNFVLRNQNPNIFASSSQQNLNFHQLAKKKHLYKSPNIKIDSKNRVKCIITNTVNISLKQDRIKYLKQQQKQKLKKQKQQINNNMNKKQDTEGSNVNFSFVKPIEKENNNNYSIFTNAQRQQLQNQNQSNQLLFFSSNKTNIPLQHNESQQATSQKLTSQFEKMNLSNNQSISSFQQLKQYKKEDKNVVQQEQKLQEDQDDDSQRERQKQKQENSIFKKNKQF